MAEAKYFWVPDDIEVWAYAQLVTASPNSNDTTKYKIVKSQKIVAALASKCLPAPNHLLENERVNSYPDDLVSLSDVNQGAILYNTRQRFMQKLIYTSCGMVLMSVNPFELIRGLYGEKEIFKYRNPNQSDLPTHVYSIPSRAYHAMCSFNKDQSILISGESGAGKIHYLTICFVVKSPIYVMDMIIHQEKPKRLRNVSIF
jgi:myosin heavy subunit